MTFNYSVENACITHGHFLIQMVALKPNPSISQSRGVQTLLAVLAITALLLTGCARHYVITLNNGAQITCRGKPKLVGETYVYKDARGQSFGVPSLRVREVAPASMVKENQPVFKPSNAR
ncbi:MAG: YgdI/YgdR family lipoprotein [Verrucomicrobia bacterium]|nr:MAG: YgdI/YgdR family lipoprotein [Verrucomicrobiota bacterium]